LINFNLDNKVLEQKVIKQIWLSEELVESYNLANLYFQNRQKPGFSALFKITKTLDISVKDLIIKDHRFGTVRKTK
jgi:hypothetical protein